MATFSRRRGFTLVELLVVITIIGLLMALLLPAVQAVRAQGRKTTCMNNMGQLAKAMISYDSSKEHFPGYVQNISGKANGEFLSGNYDNSNGYTVASTSDVTSVRPFSWAAMLLSRIERQDVWDAMLAAEGPNRPNIIRREPTFVCPDDAEARANVERPALTYIGNSGAWDRTVNERYLNPKVNNIGDTDDNGVMHDLALGNQKVRMGGIRDGAATTLMLSENYQKTYVNNTNAPLFTWAFSFDPNAREQHFGMVWVVSENPQSGDGIHRQESINRNVSDKVVFFTLPNDQTLFARPASQHGGGVNVAFCDGHTKFLREDVDFKVYQRLLTTNGSKCVDPLSHEPVSAVIQAYRVLPPLSTQDYE